MSETRREFLPVGSVVKLKNIDKRLVIAGILQMEEGKEVLHDYLGVPYPEGFLGPGYNFLFDTGNIETVVFRGYEDEEREGFVGMLGIALDAAAQEVQNEIADAQDDTSASPVLE